MEDSLRNLLLTALPHAERLASAPGRVNLIGEHTDYNGFGVLPLAIQHHVAIAAAPCATAELSIRSVAPERYPPETVPIDQLLQRDRRGSWTDYVIAAARAAAPAAGMELVVAGDLPAAAGLASSSALVVAAMLAMRQGSELNRIELAEQARLAERYVGTLSGGMDQACALLARTGHALQMDFAPLRADPVRLPPELAVLVVDSGVPAAKGGAAQTGYNARVRECTRAAAALGAPAGGDLAAVPPTQRRPERLTDPTLRRRAAFVYAEAARRDAAVAALQHGDLHALGALIDASHAGLRDAYEVSHPAVDALVASLRQAGALGARIVGAGFGGCAMAIAHRDDVARIRQRLGPGRRLLVCEPSGPARCEFIGTVPYR